MTTLPSRTPENEALERENALLRDELARLLVERTQLIEITAPWLEDRYRLALGMLQLQVLGVDCDVRRLRRKNDLLWQALNRGRSPDLAAIEVQLDIELAEWQIKLQEEIARLDGARESLSGPRMSAQEVRELRELFLGLAKRCHPDVNPDGGDSSRHLWLQASDAYVRRDVKTLQALSLLAEDVAATSEGTADAMRQRRDEVKKAIGHILVEMEELSARFPFSIRDRLEDPEWVAGERTKLEQRLVELADERVLLEASLARTISGGADA